MKEPTPISDTEKVTRLPTVRPAATPARVTKRRAETRARLMTAAATVFAERGFGQVSIEQICAAAGYSRGAFYSNFDSPEELFFALYAQRAEALSNQVAQALTTHGGGNSVPELVEKVVNALTVDRQWIMIKTDFLLHAARTPALAPVLGAQRDALRDILAPHLAAAVDIDALPQTLRTPAGLARAVTTIYDGATIQLLVDPDQEALRRWLQDVLVGLLDRAAEEPT